MSAVNDTGGNIAGAAESGEVRLKRWTAPGPKSLEFMQLDGPFLQGLCGPIGSAKTSTVCVKVAKLAQMQPPSPIDGVRYFKVGAVRDTYRQLEMALLPSWYEWFPKEAGEWVGGKNEPGRHTLRYRLADGSVVELVAEFIAIGDNNAEDVLRGYNVTCWLLNEMDLVARDVYRYCRGRAGRYPSMEHGGPRWYGILGDMNGPLYGSWPLEAFYSGDPDAVLIQQPSGRSPDAENLHNLPAGYYDRQLAGADEPYIRRMIDALPGFSRAGKPVYPEFNDDFHAAAHALEPVEGLPLLLGGDAGRTPAVIVGQKLPGGRLVLLDEICTQQTGAKTMGRLVNELLADRYPAWAARKGRAAVYGEEAPIQAWGDPAAGNGTELDDDETWLEIMSSVTGIRWRPAPCPDNNLEIRLGAVRDLLTTNIDGRPGLLVSPRCRMIREGFNQDYRYRRLKVTNQEVYDEKPDKRSAHSHPHDALQYLAVGALGYAGVLGRRKAAVSADRPLAARSARNPAGLPGGPAAHQRRGAEPQTRARRR